MHAPGVWARCNAILFFQQASTHKTTTSTNTNKTTIQQQITVYSLGFYVDGPAAKRALAPLNKGGGSSVKANQKLFDGACAVVRFFRRHRPVSAPSLSLLSPHRPTPTQRSPQKTELIRPDAGFERTLRLVISFGSIKPAQFVSAIEERLAPPLAKAGQSGALHEFAALFDGASFKKGSEITFTAAPGGKLVTRLDGRQVVLFLLNFEWFF